MVNSRVSHIKNCKNSKGDYILYWMVQSQRIHYNHALNLGIILSNLHGMPLVVYFGVSDDYPKGNTRHRTFMMEGLEYLKMKLNRMGIKFVIYRTSPEKGCMELMKNASHLIMDVGYTRIQKQWRKEVIDNWTETDCTNIIEVEDDVLVPVNKVTDKTEHSMSTIKPKIMENMEEFAIKFKPTDPFIRSRYIDIECPFEEIISPLEEIESMKKKNDISPSSRFKGGEKEARDLFYEFFNGKIGYYLEKNHPELDYASNLSPYLHFGHISPVEIVLVVKKIIEKNPFIEKAVNAFIEDLIIKRELAINFVNFTDNYDKFEHMTDQWAYDTMEKHKNDKREYIYTTEEFESCSTHDKYWNAAMKEMVETGFMHTYMRMYWCKKIIEWSTDYKTAYDTAIYLNNKYFIDGWDPNSYAGVAWCFGKFDRPCEERPVFGKIRYMSKNGLHRKFDMDKYIEKIENLTGEKV
jgi:deoxyribodipyrimidine photo-lyase